MKSLIIAYYVLNILASIVAIIMPFLSFITINTFSFYIDACCYSKHNYCSEISSILMPLIFVNIFVKLPVAIIASIKAKTILNNMNPPSNHDIEMNDIANVDQTEQTTNKSE